MTNFSAIKDVSFFGILVFLYQRRDTRKFTCFCLWRWLFLLITVFDRRFYGIAGWLGKVLRVDIVLEGLNRVLIVLLIVVVDVETLHVVLSGLTFASITFFSKGKVQIIALDAHPVLIVIFLAMSCPLITLTNHRISIYWHFLNRSSLYYAYRIFESLIKLNLKYKIKWSKARAMENIK